MLKFLKNIVYLVCESKRFSRHETAPELDEENISLLTMNNINPI